MTIAQAAYVKNDRVRILGSTSARQSTHTNISPHFPSELDIRCFEMEILL